MLKKSEENTIGWCKIVINNEKALNLEVRQLVIKHKGRTHM